MSSTVMMNKITILKIKMIKKMIIMILKLAIIILIILKK